MTDFDYILPPELVARYPLKERTASRLLCLDRQTGSLQHKHFVDILKLIRAGDLIVFNNTRVIPARLLGKKMTGGRVEVLAERIIDAHTILCHLKASKKPKIGDLITFSKDIQFEMKGRKDDLFQLHCRDTRPVIEVIEAVGEIPLPPYFDRAPVEEDQARYQTVYAQHKGSVAAPTAGLHFDDAILEALQQQNVELGFLTLHVGAGTFSPVRVSDITQHKMHAEYIHVSPELCEQIKATKARGGRVIAVGTTAARSLETIARQGEPQPFSGETDIFIYPGFKFKCVDVLITNFHLPGSTLLMLVSAFGGYDAVMKAYQEAIQAHYRFFSYGDAMWIAPSAGTG